MGGICHLFDGNFSCFIGGVHVLVARSMDESMEDFLVGDNSADLCGSLDAIPFHSFTHDLEHLEGVEADDRGTGGAQTELDLFGSLEPAEVDSHSVPSPTTLADDDLADQRLQQHDKQGETNDFQQVSSQTEFNFEAALNVAFNSASAEKPKQIWETGIWKHIFGDDDTPLDFEVWGPEVTRPTPTAWGVDSLVLDTDAQGSKKRRHEPTFNFLDVVTFKPDVPWQDQREADLQRGIKLWIAVSSKWNEECSMACRLAEMRTEAEVFNMFAHVFTGRAPVTVRKRGAAVLRICDYLEANLLETFPMQEITFYRFLCQEEAMGAPKSRLKGFLQAIAFCRHVLDVTELQCILDSKRCSGVATESCPRERRQASPLTVLELKKLHEVVDDGSDPWDSVFAGAALLCCYCRGRWGDLMRSESTFIDYDANGKPAYVETRIGRHKTMSSQMHRHQFLPMVAPVMGVHGGDWATPWLEQRVKLGLLFPPHGLVMPAPDKDGQASQRPLESGECGRWIRRLLGLDVATGLDPSRRVSSHSLKSTMLSFAAKRGLSVPDRLMLGYHASQMHMAMVYSRDGAAASLILLERLITEIARGKFQPDNTRSGRVVESPVDEPASHSAEVKVEVVVSSDEEQVDDLPGSDGSDSTSESDSSSGGIPENHGLNKVFAPPAPPEGFQSWQHSKLKTIHLTEPGYFRVFVCGRPVGNYHHRITQDPRFDSPVCWACFKKANARDGDQQET